MGLSIDGSSKNDYKADIDHAAKLEHEVAFYTYYSPGSKHKPLFEDRVRKIYNNDSYKVKRFKEAFQGDILPSVELLRNSWNQLYKVFDAQNPVANYQFSDNSYREEAVKYLSKFDKFWKTEGWQRLKTRYNSLVVVDLPEFQEGNRPEPYIYFVDIVNVKHIEFVEDSHQIKEVKFKGKIDGADVYLYYTDEFYSVLQDLDDQPSKENTSTHDLGYCPVNFFWSDLLNNESKILRKIPVVDVLENLFKYCFKSIEAFKADLLYLNPDKQAPKSSCGYEGANEKCFGGKLVNENKQPIISNNIQRLCPHCGTNQHLGGGAGNLITIDFNNDAVREGKVNPSMDLVRYIMPDIKGIQEQYKRIQQLEDSINKSIAGEDNVITRESINELQQEAKYQSKETILTELSDRLSDIITWTENTILKLMYGDMFNGCTKNLGNKFFIRTIDELQRMLNESTNPIQRTEIQKQIIETKYKNNPDKKRRETLLYDLMPYSSLNDSMFHEYVKMGKISDYDITLRTNFDNIISELEMRYGNIATFWDYSFAESVKEYQKLKTIKSLITEIINDNYQLKVNQNELQD